MEKHLASIDVGSHTARLLIVRASGDTGGMRQLVRKRVYIRLAEGFDTSRNKIIQPEAMARALDAVWGFSRDVGRFDVSQIRAVATGVVREATNGKEFLDRILERAGVRVRLISGAEEALLTAKGALHPLKLPPDAFLVFDLGGGSTEFFFGSAGATTVRSVPLGAVILKTQYLKSDPPKSSEVDALSKHVDRCLEESKPEVSTFPNGFFVVGTGGTVTTLAAMIHDVPPEEITPERMNGLVLGRQEIETLFGEIRNLSVEQIGKLPGLDEGRADVMVAGSLAAIRILHFCGAHHMTVSLSDLLEGIVIKHLTGERNDSE